jgi:hypothetical protein
VPSTESADAPETGDDTPAARSGAGPPSERKQAPLKRTGPKTEPQPPGLEGRGGKDHKYLQHLVKRLGEERGFRATIEDSILRGAGRVDVSLVRADFRLAVEISITTGSQWESKNIKQSCQEGFDQILLLTRSERTKKSFEKRLAEELPKEEYSRVRVLLADELVDYLDQFAVKQDESTVRGYKVKLRRHTMSQEDVARRRSDIASVIARSLDKGKGK